MRTLSIVVPLRNEADALPLLIAELERHLVPLPYKIELVFVDDGSTDQSWDTIRQAIPRGFSVCGVRLARNFGKEQAIRAGLREAAGDAVVVMDADLQHPPALIPALVARWEETKCYVVHATKSDRVNESAAGGLGLKLFQGMLRIMSEVNIAQASDFKLLDRRMVVLYLALPERNPFFRALIPWLGHEQESIAFSPDRRVCGDTKWNTGGRVALAIRAVVSFSTLPLYISTIVGVLMFFAALTLGVQTLYVWWSGAAVEGFTTVILLLISIGSILMMSLGVIGLYLAEMFQELKRRPGHLVERVHRYAGI